MPLVTIFQLNAVFQGTILGHSPGAWAIATGGATAVFGALVFVRWLLIRRLGAIAARSTTAIDDVIVELLQRTTRLFLVVLAIWPAIGWLGISERPGQILRILVVAIVTLQLAIWIGIAVTRIVEARLRRADPAAATTLGALAVLIRGTLYVLLVLLALANLGVDVTAVLTGLGIGGVAVALALQNILGDLFASLSIVLDKPFVVGDFIVVGTQMGTVEHIGLKTTRVRSLSGEQLIFGNNDLLKSRVQNFKRMQERRVVFTVGVVYETPPAVLGEISTMLRSIVEAQQTVRFDRAHFTRFDDSALTFEIVYFVLDPDYNRYMDIHQRILLAVVERFEREGIAFAFPTRTVHLMSETGGRSKPVPAG